MSNWGFKEAGPILRQYEQHAMKKKTKSKLSFAYFGWSGSLKKACSESLDKVQNISPQFSICCVCFDVTLYMQIKIGKGKRPSLLFIAILANVMSSTH